MDLSKLVQVQDSSDKYLCICIPQSVKWEDYKKELKSVEDWSQEMNFKVRALPKIKCDRCYLCYKNQIIGWMKVTGYSDNEFNCTTTGKHWEGKFIKRSGPFHKIKPVPYSSFRGFRYLSLSEVGE